MRRIANQRQPGRWPAVIVNGIRFKSITPQNDVLLIKFDSRAQSAAAKVVLDRTLPQGYIIAQQDDDSRPAAWLGQAPLSRPRSAHESQT